MKLKFAVILIISLIIPQLLFSYNGFTSRNISNENGLSQNDVNAIFYDSYGYLWCGTNDGLDRYDGYEFKHFNIGDCGLDSNLIISFAEDKNRNIWVGTANEGGYLYLRGENRFIKFSDMSDEAWIDSRIKAVKNITIDSEGVVWAYDSREFCILKIEFDYEELKIENIRLYSDFERLNNGNVTQFCITEEDKLYAATSKGVALYSRKDDSFTMIEGLSVGYINDISCYNSYLFLLYTDKLVSYNTSTGQTQTIDQIHGGTAMVWQGNSLWVSSILGVYTTDYQSTTNSFSTILYADRNRNYRGNDMVIDNNDGIWVGYNKKGLVRFEHNKRPFILNRGLGNDFILQISEDSQNRLWICSDGTGVFVCDKSSRKEPIKHLFTSEICYSAEYSKYDNTQYVATHQYLYKVNPNTFAVTDLGYAVSSIRDIKCDSCYLWLSSYGEGLARYDIRDGSILKLGRSVGMPSDIVRNTIIDTKGNLWIATDHGLAMIKKEQRYAENPKIELVAEELTSKHYVIPILEDKEGNIWYGTLGRGLHMLTKDKNSDSYKIKSYTTVNGLSNNSIKAIVEDNSGNIWFSSNRGICCINKENSHIYTYQKDDGLQGYEFNELSAINSDGTIIFGGTNGFNYLKPNQFERDRYQELPTITDFSLFNVSIFESDKYKHLLSGINDNSSGFRLNFTQNSFSFKLSNLNFSNPERCKYRYWLEGYDKQKMVISGLNPIASYVNVTPGKYKFHLQSSSGDDTWGETELVVPITVVPPFWATWIAFVFYAIIFFATMLSIIQNYIRRVKRHNAIALARMERNKANEMLEMRTKFFTNISHEFRTPLTLILSPLQKIMSDSPIANDSKWQHSLNTMSHNANSLLRLINELLNYVKNENGKLKIELTNNDFAKTSRKLVDQFNFWAEQKEIKLESDIPNHSIQLFYDKYMMEQIIYNLISNAIKHTPIKGTVAFSVVDRESDLLFFIRDTGKGISKKIEKHLFERFTSLNLDSSNEVGGIGIGLVLTKSLVEMHNGKIWFETAEGSGTTFFVLIPKQFNKVEDSDDAILDNKAILNEDRELFKTETAITIPESNQLEDETEDSIDKNLPTMLIVDDNNEILNLLASLFSNRYQILFASDGREGIEKAIELIPDIIISDIMMPEVDGLELCKRLKHEQNTSHIPIVLLTAKTSDNDMVDGLRTLADAYCSKPFNNKVLIETVNSILRNRKLLAKQLAHKAIAISIDKASTTNIPLEVKTDSNKLTDKEVVTEAKIDNSTKESIKTQEEVVDTTTNMDKEFLRKLTEYIEQNINNTDFVVSDICDKMGITPIALNKKLKSLLNMTANALIRTIRLKRAATLLKTGRYSIADVTYDVGFGDLRYFRECFKKEYGMLPQAYKDSFLDNTKEEQEQ
ncbi:MAG: two-component regulator propeller domain-containing protein [Rikenellaceae bacterium]